MKLKDILNDVEIIDIRGSICIDIEGIEFDSRKVIDNTLFVCVRGFSVDGHNFIKNAMDLGARAFLIEENLDFLGFKPNLEKYTFIQVKNTRETMAKIASNFNFNPSSKMNVIGVTGTNGKTSITTFLNEILSNNNKRVGLVGTIKIFDGVDEIQ